MRIDKVSALVKRHVAEIIQRELRDPELGLVTITKVNLANDLGQARIYFTVLDKTGQPGNKKENCNSLNKAAGFIRHQLAQKLTTRTTPKLIFEYDDSLDMALQVEQILRDERQRDS